jgi:CHAT domain-containing protein
VALASLPVFLLLSDAPTVNASVTYDHAESDFIHGYLEASQGEARRGYQRFLYSNPAWARKFQLLEATAMTWRSLNEDALRTLADETIPWDDPEKNIQRLALEASALTYLHRLPEAEAALVAADKLCVVTDSVQCGAVLRAHGLLLLERGQTRASEKSFRESLDFAHDRKDTLLEATAFLNLGHCASEGERHDEALSFYQLSAAKAAELSAADLQESALGDQGWEQYALGNTEKALEMFAEAKRRAVSLGDIGDQLAWLTAAASAYGETGQLALAESSDLQAIELARKFSKKQSIIDASMDLAQVYVREGKPDEADHYAKQAGSMAQETGSPIDILNSHLLLGEAAALRQDWPRADPLLHEVLAAADSQPSMKWDAAHTLGNVYEAEGQAAAAGEEYKTALTLVETSRAELKEEASQLPFLNNAARIYDDYIHFLVSQGHPDEALEAADWSRARTLQTGLGVVSKTQGTKPPALKANQIARRANATLLFYWLGERQSYLWAITPEKTTLIALPAKGAIIAMMERYRNAVLALKDPIKDGNRDARDLYQTLIVPAQDAIRPDRPVILFADEAMSQTSFETLVVPGPAPHYWIDDAVVSSAPSIRLIGAQQAVNRTASAGSGKLLLLGNSISVDPGFPNLPMAGLEMKRVGEHFSNSSRAVFEGAQATPAAYLESRPEQYAYIHFVSHGTASRTDPLESAVILSRASAADDSYKLYAREIVAHRIDARLVTISACNSSGIKTYTGEGLVGLAWAFLRAGAHNVIGALWEVSDESTPELMDQLYLGLGKGEPPAVALREAKLSLVHSGGSFARPFYWAPFQLYAGR